MQGYSFTPPTAPPREGHKSKILIANQYLRALSRLRLQVLIHVTDYVFVDEHNRHKRLKGMKSLALNYLALSLNTIPLQ